MAGFVVSTTRRIRRVSWDKILPPTSDAFRSITGMMVLEDNEFLFMIDFEDIVAAVDRKSVGTKPGGKAGASTSEVLYGTYPTSPIGSHSSAILVVEDSPVARKAVCEIVRDLGFQVLEANDGEAGWRLLLDAAERDGAKSLSAVITDIEMPRLDGFSLIKRVRENNILQRIPIVVHSSLSADTNRERAISVGANGFASKYNRKEIVEALRSAMGGG